MTQCRGLLASGFSRRLASTPTVVIDWKTDVDPSPETLEHYRAQVRAYLDATGAARGLVVAVTSGTVLTVLPTRDGGRT